jgi:nitroimidazol reductase NimA-like FMN-containing flavoprotein (pyridoxamine 5'-phosphate oxidase superfamily)
MKRAMREKDKEITDPAEIERIVKGARVCRLGFADGGEPYVVPVCFGYEDNALYFHCAPEGRKIDLIKKNNRVCVEVEADVEIVGAEKSCGWSTRYRSVIGLGRARILESEEDRLRGLAVLMRQFGEKEPDIELGKAASAAVVRIDMEYLSGKKSGY